MKMNLENLMVLEFIEDIQISPHPSLVVSINSSGINFINIWILQMLEDDEHFRMPIVDDDWIQKYLDHDFYMLFRMKKSTFYNFIELIGRYYKVPKYSGGRSKPLTLEKMLMIFLWYVSKGSGMNTIADRFNVSLKSVHSSVTKVLGVLQTLKYELIKWPTEEECIKIESGFKKKSKFPGVIGAMDGCHFKLKVNKLQHDSYQDRHFDHSITMQAICVSNMKYTNISVGYPGSLHDGRILWESSLYRDIVRNGAHKYFFGKYHLVADSAYPCKSWIMTPYKFTPVITQPQRKYNKALSQQRVVIEHSFGQLKGRWRILQYINVYTIKRAVDIVVACCTLHNFCLENNDVVEEQFQDPSALDDFQYMGYVDVDGATKRGEIVALLNNMNVL